MHSCPHPCTPLITYVLAAAAHSQEEGVPLGERVAAMEARAEGSPADRKGEQEDEAPGPSGSSKADSVAVLLTQALRRWA